VKRIIALPSQRHMITTLLGRFDLTKSMQVYQLLRTGTAVITGVLLAKSGLKTEELGTWEALLFIGTLVVFTGVNGLLQAISPSYLQQSEQERPVFMQEVVLLFFALGGAIFTILLLFENILVPFFTGHSSLPGFGWYALFLFLQLPSLPTEIHFLVKNRPAAIFWWGLLGFGAQVIAVVIPAWWGWGLELMLQVLCAQAAVKLVFTFWIVGPIRSLQVQQKRITQYIQLAWPLVAASFVGNLIVFFDTWLVAHWFSDLSTFAIYRYGSRELPFALALASALGTSMVPRLIGNFNKGLQELRTRSATMFHVVFPSTILLLLTVHEWFPVVFNQALAPAASLFAIYLLLSLSRVLLPNSILVALSDVRIIWIVSLAELTVKVGTGWLFLHWWGLEGLAWSAILSFWFEKLALISWLWRKHSLPPSKWLHWKLYLLYTFLVAFVFGIVHGGY
jgi:O-antigen/teichoic acid export membrane protein